MILWGGRPWAVPRTHGRAMIDREGGFRGYSMGIPDVVVRQNRSRGLMGSAWFADIRRLYEGFDGGTVRKIALTLMAPGAHAVTAFRFGHWLLDQPTLVRLVLDPVYHVFDILVHVLWGI